MKYILSFLILTFGITAAQSQLKFDKRFIDAEDRWVILAPNKDSSYGYGFVYLDVQAGLTLNLEGKFTIDKDGKFIPEKIQNAMMKYRLQPTRTLVAFVPENKFNELSITAIPEWLHVYKTDEQAPQRLYRLGFTYNAWNECDKALEYLEKLEKTDPSFKGLAVELSFSYNCLGKFDKAVEVLEKAVKSTADNCYLYKELTYAYQQKKDLNKAINAAESGIAHCEDKTMKAEIAYNMSYTYYTLKDKTSFSKWAQEARKWLTENDQLYKSLKQMEDALNK
jgi:tetratricopeptide (TPR) repeat protein